MRKLFLLIFVLSCKEDAAIAVPKLTKKLESKNLEERNQAALDLGKYGKEAKSAVPYLARRLYDDNSGVRTSAAYSLRIIDTPEARKALDGYKK